MKNEKEIIKELEDLLVNTIRNNIPDSKFGLLLSGGLDSSIIAFILKKLNCDFQCYVTEISNGNFKKSEDILFSEKLAKDLNLNLKKIIITGDEIEKAIKNTMKIIKNKDVIMTSIALPLYFCFKEAKKDKCKALFSGVGSDTLFAGFEKHRRAEDINKFCIESLPAALKKTNIRDKKLAKNFNIKLILPFLNKNIINYALKIPGKYKIKNKVEKYILRQTAKKIGLPEYIYKRKKKAIQYSSNSFKSMQKLAKRNNFKYVKDYLENLDN